MQRDQMKYKNCYGASGLILGLRFLVARIVPRGVDLFLGAHVLGHQTDPLPQLPRQFHRFTLSSAPSKIHPRFRTIAPAQALRSQSTNVQGLADLGAVWAECLSRPNVFTLDAAQRDRLGGRLAHPVHAQVAIRSSCRCCCACGGVGKARNGLSIISTGGLLR